MEAPAVRRGAPRAPTGLVARLAGLVWPLDRAHVLAGLLLGIAATARLPLVFAAPFLMLVGGGGSLGRRTSSAAVGAVIPVGLLLGYTYLTSGAFVHPGYDYQYQLEANGYPTLDYNPDWSVEDVRYIPQNLGIMFGSLPLVAPTIKPDTLGLGPVIALCTDPTAGARPVRRGVPARHAGRHRDEHPPERAGPPPRPVRDPPAADRPADAGRRRHGPRRGAVQPRALQPGLGAVGLPLLARLHPVPAAARRARGGTRRRTAVLGSSRSCSWRRARSSTCGASPGGRSLAGEASGGRRQRRVRGRGWSPDGGSGRARPGSSRSR